MSFFSWLLSAEGVFRTCEIVAIVAGVLTVSALIGKDRANRIIQDRKAVEMVNLQKDLADAKTRQAEAESRLLELQKLLLEPRHLNAGEARKILKAGPKGSVEIMYIDGNPGAYWLAWQLYELLATTGWHVALPKPAAGRPPLEGVQLEIGSDGFPQKSNDPKDLNLPEPGMTLYRVLEVGMKGLGKIGVTAKQDLPKGALVIVVGPKF